MISHDRAQLVREVVGERKGPVRGPHQPGNAKRDERLDEFGAAGHRRTGHHVDVEQREHGRAEQAPYVDPSALRLLLQRRDPRDLEAEVVADVGVQRRPERLHRFLG